MLTCSGLVFSMALSNADEKLVAALCAPPCTGFSQRRSPSTLCILLALSIAVLVCCKADLIFRPGYQVSEGLQLGRCHVSQRIMHDSPTHKH